MYKSYDELPGVLGVKELKDFLGISRAGAYQLLHRQDFPTLHVASRLLVAKDKAIDRELLAQIHMPHYKCQKTLQRLWQYHLETENDTVTSIRISAINTIVFAALGMLINSCRGTKSKRIRILLALVHSYGLHPV